VKPRRNPPGGPPVIEDRSVLSRSCSAPDQVLRYGPDPDHVVDVRFAAAQHELRPLVMLVHGGFWRPQYDRRHTGPMGEALAAAGWTVATIEYRRTPGQPDATVGDVALAIEQVPSLIEGHDGRLLLLGHSAGGHLVLWAASHCRSPALRGVLALAPAADLQLAHSLALGDHAVLAFLGGEPQHRPDLDPARLPAPRIPSLVLHGELDTIVPLSVVEAYRARHAGTELVRLPGAGHFAVIDPLSSAWKDVLAALERLR
jgi:acetyl esterase/lipase